MMHGRVITKSETETISQPKSNEQAKGEKGEVTLLD
jgi:hypothetical protein